ncbi:unnamed protein product, partial [Allacma fusca]
ILDMAGPSNRPFGLTWNQGDSSSEESDDGSEIEDAEYELSDEEEDPILRQAFRGDFKMHERWCRYRRSNDGGIQVRTEDQQMA